MSSEPIRLLDLAEQNGPLLPEIRAAFERVAASNFFILGPEVTGFEEEAGRYLGVHALGMSSGTDALLAALMALDIGPGDEVITTPFSFFATVGTILRVGATPVFVDIVAADFNIDASRIEAAITPRTKAVLPVHLFGQACDLTTIAAICQRHGLKLIEDAAQSMGAKHRGKQVGTIGEVGCFSFFPSKTLGCFGDGGMVSTRVDGLVEKLLMIRNHGSKVKYHHPYVGGNFRIDALQAAILRVKLPHVDRWAEGRKHNAALYDRLFADAGLPAARLTPPARVDDGHVYNQYVIRTDRRDALKQHLIDSNIGCDTYYPSPLHLQPCMESLGYKPGSMPIAEESCRQVLALPIYAELGDEKVTRVAQTVVKFLRG